MQDRFINENAKQNESGGLRNDMTEDWGMVPGKPVIVKGSEEMEGSVNPYIFSALI